MNWLSSANGPIHGKHTNELDAQKLKVLAEMMTLSDQYQITYNGSGFRAGVASMSFDIKGKNKEHVDILRLRERVVGLGYSQERLCRENEGIMLEGYPDESGEYFKVLLRWCLPEEYCNEAR